MEAPLAGLVADPLRGPLRLLWRVRGGPATPFTNRNLCRGGAAAAFPHVPGAESPKVDGSGVRSDVELSMVNGVEVGRRGRHPGPGR